MTNDYTGAHRILRERERQVWDEGWSDEHDDQHFRGEMAIAGACYACHAATFPYRADIQAYRNAPPPPDWPWEAKWWKPRQPQHDLVRAGALIAAEIDRIERSIVARVSVCQG